jgi:integrase
MTQSFVFTDAGIRHLEPQSKPYERRDLGLRDSVQGLYIRVQKNGNKLFYVNYKTPEGRRKPAKLGDFPATNVKEARRLALGVKGDAAKGIDTNEKRSAGRAALVAARLAQEREKTSTVKGFLDVFEEYLHKDRRYTHPEEESKRVRRAFPSLLNKRLDKLTTADIKAWESTDAAHKQDSTIGRDLNSLGKLLSVAKVLGYIDTSPLEATARAKADYKRPKSAKPIENSEPRYLEKDEEERLREALDERDEKLADNPDEYADFLTPYVLVGMATGCRPSELLQLDWRHVDIERKQATVSWETSRKSNKTRRVPLSAEARTVLAAWGKQTGTTGLVFMEDAKDLGITTLVQRVRRALKPVAKSARIHLREFGPYDLRHHFGSWFILRGGNPLVLAQIMGHSTIDMTRRYTQLKPDHLAAALEILDK